MSTLQNIEAALRERFPNAEHLSLIEFSGGDHFRTEIVDAAFAGLSRINQHKLVYAAVDQYMKDGTIHCLSITTRTPAASTAATGA